MNEAEFHDLANRGWTLIAIIQEKGVLPANSSVPCSGPINGTDYCSHNTWFNSGDKDACTQENFITTPYEITITKYVMGRDEKTIIGDLSENLEKVSNELLLSEQDRENLRKQWVSSNEEVREKEKEAVSLERSAENYRKQIADQDDRIVVHLKTINKMENDLGRVREHIGKVQYNDALKEDTKT